MTLPWLCLGAALALNELRTIGLATLLRRPNAAVLGPLATWVWMAAGAAWLTAHRLGLEPLGFDRAITLLTVAHFHVAGLGLTALLVVTHRHRPGTTMLAAIWLHQAGMLTVAAGITFSDHLEVAGATTITVALAIWAAIAVAWIRDEPRGIARILLTVAAIAWVLPMALALGWALGTFDLFLLGALAQRIFGTMTSEVLIAIPLFVFMGIMLEKSKIAEELLEAIAVVPCAVVREVYDRRGRGRVSVDRPGPGRARVRLRDRRSGRGVARGDRVGRACSCTAQLPPGACGCWGAGTRHGKRDL
jgi:hypothetical protein